MVKEGKVAANSLISLIRNEKAHREAAKDNNGMRRFNYKTKSIMSEICKRTGVGEILGIRVQGFAASRLEIILSC